MTLLHPDLDKCHSYLTYHLADKEKYVPPARRGMPFITISREAGAGGHSLSELLYGYLDMKCPLPESDWTVFDKDLVQAAMEEHGLPQRFGKYLAEKRVSEIKSLIGDCYDRYLVRMEEIRQSASIVQQVIETIPEGPYFAEDAKKIFPPTKEKIMSSMEELIQNFMITTQGPQMPAGEVYFEAENPNVRGALSVGFIETLPDTHYKWDKKKDAEETGNPH